MKSPLLTSIPGIDHGFGSVAEPVPARLQGPWQKQKPQWKQVHGTSVAEVTAPGQQCGEVDGLWTSTKGQWVGSVTADCVPVLLSTRDGNLVAALHAGWRGTFARIIERTLEGVLFDEAEPSRWVAALGPCIGPCCFEVGEDLQEKFLAEFPDFDRSKLNPRHRHLDLAWLNAEILRRLGVSAVEILPHCTRCARGPTGDFLFHSFRREGGGTRQLSIIGVESTPSG